MRTLLLPLLLLAAACAHAPRAAARLPAGAFVLVRRDAWLLSAPELLAREGRAFAPVELRGEPRLELAWAMRLVGQQGEFALVETLAETGPHCHDGPGELEGLRLRFFVRRTDLLPLTRKEVRLSFPDQTSVILAPGLALEPLGTTWYIHAGFFRLRVRVPEEAIGLSYAAPPRASETERLAQDHPRLLDRFFAHELVPWNAPVVLDAEPSVLVTGHTPVFAEELLPAESVLVTLKSRCIELVAIAHPLFQLTLFQAGRYGGSGAWTFPEEGDRTVVTAGATIYWADGTVAGAVETPTSFHGIGGVHGGRQCFVRLLRQEEDDANPLPEHRMTLCFDPKDLSTRGPEE